jgi:hypothetical protein
MFQQGPWIAGWGGDELDPKTETARILNDVRVSEIIWPGFSAKVGGNAQFMEQQRLCLPIW